MSDYATTGQQVWQNAWSASHGELSGVVGIGTLVANGMAPGTAQSVMMGAVEGITTGASAGSLIVPGIGTVVGAVVGAIIGIVQALTGGPPTDNRPLFLQKAEAVPVPGVAGHAPPVAWVPTAAGLHPNPDQVPGVDLATWWASHLHGNYGSSDITHQVATEVAEALWSADQQHGTLLLDFGGLQGLQDAIARWSRLVGGPNPMTTSLVDHPVNAAPGNPIFFPQDDDSFGWFLNGVCWDLAARNVPDQEALQYFLMVQWTMKVMSGPDNEPHLMYMIGRMKVLLQAAAPLPAPPPNQEHTQSINPAVLKGFKLVPSMPGPSSAGTAVFAGGLGLLLYFFL